MESKRSIRGKGQTDRIISIAAIEDDAELDRRLIEAMERIERIRSKAAFAVGSLLASSR